MAYCSGMCLITFAFTPDSAGHLLLAANRDEFHDRPARPMAWWAWPRGPLAGRDQRGGGTWLAVGRDGRWAAVTNFRDPKASPGAVSRGELPAQFVINQAPPATYVRSIHARRDRYGPFNLLAGDREQVWYCSTHAAPQEIQPGIHALSNGLLDEPWPKTRRGATALRGLAETGADLDPERLFELMDDRAPADDEALPDTGVEREIERMLSPPFIVSDRYGTRCTTVVSLGARCLAAERSFATDGRVAGQLRYEFSSGISP